MMTSTPDGQFLLDTKEKKLYRVVNPDEAARYLQKVGQSHNVKARIPYLLENQFIEAVEDSDVTEFN